MKNYKIMKKKISMKKKPQKKQLNHIKIRAITKYNNNKIMAINKIQIIS